MQLDNLRFNYTLINHHMNCCHSPSAVSHISTRDKNAAILVRCLAIASPWLLSQSFLKEKASLLKTGDKCQDKKPKESQYGNVFRVYRHKLTLPHVLSYCFPILLWQYSLLTEHSCSLHGLTSRQILLHLKKGQNTTTVPTRSAPTPALGQRLSQLPCTQCTDFSPAWHATAGVVSVVQLNLYCSGTNREHLLTKASFKSSAAYIRLQDWLWHFWHLHLSSPNMHWESQPKNMENYRHKTASKKAVQALLWTGTSIIFLF